MAVNNPGKLPLFDKVKIPAIALALLTAGAAIVAQISDDVSWKVPLATGIAFVIQFVTGYATPEKAAATALRLRR